MAAFEDVSSPDLEQFKGGKWTDWFEAVQSTESNQPSIPDHALKRDNEVARLRIHDMTLFGYRPANDRFYLVKCEHCGRLVKPQSLSTHFERKHGSFKLSKPPSSRLSTHKHGKPQVDPTNHKISYPSRHSSHASSHQKSSEPAYTKGSSTSEKLSSGTTPEKDKRRSDVSLNKSHRPDTSSSKPLASLPVRTVKSTRNAINSETPLHSNSRKGINKPGGTIQLEEIPESHVVTSRRPSSEANMKHFQKSHRINSKYSDGDGKLNDLKSDSHMTMSKSRKNHDNYHHHLHHGPHHDAKTDNDPRSPENMKLLSPSADRKLLSPNKDRRTSHNVPVVVLQKSAITSPGGNADLTHSNKRARPPSGNYDSSLSPSRSKIPALHNATTEKELSRSSEAPAGKVRKKEKLLPLKAREYDPNKHCGVWVKDDNAHCRRSLTCKVHPLSAKRSVTGRMKPFDELVQEHGREKQRLKEKALLLKNAVSPMPPPPSPSVQSIMSPPVLSPLEFAVPSPATKCTPLSPPCTPTSQSHVSSVSKAKSSASLFPRIFAAWHVDCWDNDDVTEDTSNKLQSSCYTIQRQPQPLVVLNYQARRSANCQVSYCRKSERQLEALSSNFEKFSTKQPKKSKSLSFTPISGRTFVTSSQNHNSKQKLQKRFSTSMSKVPRTKSQELSQSQAAQGFQYCPEQTMANVAKTGNIAMYTRVKQPKIGPGSSLSRKLSNNSSISAPALTVKQFTTSDTPSKSRNRRISGQVVSLLRNNSISDTPLHISKVPDFSSASPILLLNSISPSPSPNTASTQNFYTGTINPARTMEGLNHVTAKTSKSAIGKTPVVQACSDLPELQDRKQLVVQLPNGLKSLPGNFLLKQGAHSVTLSGNIGALTVPTDDVNFMGAQLPKTVKTVNSNSNFVVQGDGSFHINNDQATISKLLAVQRTNGPVNTQQTSQINTGNTILQNDENIFLNQHIADGQNQQFSAENFVEAIAALDSQNEVNLESGSAANELVKLFQPESCSNTQLPNLHQIDTSILGQVLATSNNQQVLQNQLTAIGASQTTANANSDLSQNFMTR